jgi:hypothetical protein
MQIKAREQDIKEMEMTLKARETAIKEKEADIKIRDSEIKAYDAETSRISAVTSVILSREKNEPDEPVSTPAVDETSTQILGAINNLAEVISRPKTVVRDADGRPAGIR